MNIDSFISQQKELSDGFIDRITSQMQDFRGEHIEALIVGCDGRDVHLYEVDKM